MIEIEIPSNIKTLRRLKDTISNYIYCKNIRIFNHKGLDIDDADIEYLEPKQVLYVSTDGSMFDLVNYLNEYEFIRWIKSGGYGKIYSGNVFLNISALNVINREYCAIKKIDISNLQNDEIYNIYREALYLESFRHKNIVKFYHSFIYENNFYTVMELGRGGELSAYIDEKKYINEKTAKKLFQQIHDAVIYIHSKSVVHRDLKPNNILFLDEKKENLIVKLSINHILLILEFQDSTLVILRKLLKQEQHDFCHPKYYNLISASKWLQLCFKS